SINRHWYVGNLGYYQQVDQLLAYLRSRYLLVQAARFLQRDPEEDGPTAYSYAGSAPVKAVDPTGLVCQGVASVYGDQCCLGGHTKTRRTTFRCKPYQENCPPEDCFLHVCIRGSAMIAARWNGNPKSANAAEGCQECWDRVRVKWVDNQTHTRVLNQIEV